MSSSLDHRKQFAVMGSISTLDISGLALSMTVSPDQYMVSLEVEEDLRMLQGELQDCLKMEDWSENEWDGWKARFSLDPSSAKSELVSRLHRRVSLLTASPSGTYKHCTLIYMSNQEGLDRVSKEREQELARQPQHSPQDRYRMTYY